MRKVFFFLLLLSPIQTVIAQKTVRIVPGEEYNRSFLHEIFFGFHHRDTWDDSVDLELLSLKDYEIIKRGGSRETTNLRIKDQQGREWVLRSVNKDLTAALPEKQQSSKLLASIARDHASANFPYAPLIVASLARDLQVPVASPRLFVIMDEPLLKEHRQDFGGTAVFLEARPDESWSNDTLFFKAKKVVGTDKIFKRLKNGENIVFDTDTYLKARMLDILVGDWSRHEGQYRWLLQPSGNSTMAIPVPRDRDHALYKNDGVINSISKLFMPRMVSFRKNIRSVNGLTMVGFPVDSLVLGSIPMADYEKAALEVQKTLTDEKIKKATESLPRYGRREKDRTEIEKKLLSRRDELPQAAVKWYTILQKKLEKAES